jgi:predicted phosphatase
MGKRASHADAIPLCPAHHHGTSGLQVPSIHGSKNALKKTFGTELQLLNRVRELLGESHAA